MAWRYNIRGLCDAAGDGRLEDVKIHLQNGVDVNGRDWWNSDTALNYAIRGHHSQVVQFLLSKGATCNIRGLVKAAGDGQLEDVKVHLQNGVNVNGSDRWDGDTPLNCAMRGHHSQVVQFLLSKGATYNIRGLVDAATDGRLEDVKIHLQNGVDVNGRDWHGRTPLSSAVRNKHVKTVEFLLSKGAIGDTSRIFNTDELCRAAGAGRLEDVKILLQNVVDVNGRDWYGRTPLSRAVHNKHFKVVEFLLSKGAIGDTSEIFNIDELCRAADACQLEDVKILLQNGVDVNGKNKNGDTALNCAMRGHHSQVVQFFFSKGATCTIDGLVEAAEDGRLEDVKEHLQKGVDVNGRDRRGDAPLHRAIMRHHPQVVQFLLSKGATVKVMKMNK